MWYSYKCRAETLYDVSAFIYTIHQERYEAIRLLNTIITDIKGSFEWEFDSDKTLDELRETIKKVDKEVGDLHVMYESLNYRGVYTGERYYDNFP